MDIRVYSELGLASIRLHKTGAFRVWSMARQLDPGGQGWIEIDDLNTLRDACKVKPRTWFYWLAQARAEGWLMDGRPGVIRMQSLVKTAQDLEVEKINRRVDIPAKKLTGKSWRAYVFASIHNGKPTSRQTLKKLTGVSCRTQARYDKVVKTKRKKNIFVTDQPASLLRAAIEYGSEATNFTYYDKETKQNNLAHRRPDSRKAYGKPDILRDRWEKNKILYSANTCNYSFFGLRDNGMIVLFHDKMKAAEQTARKNGKKDIVVDAFYRVNRSVKACFYKAI